MAIDEVVNWDTTAGENSAVHPSGPHGRDAHRISRSFQELQAAIARWRDLAPVQATTTQLEDNTHAINTDAAKVLGYTVLNTTTGVTVFASGNGDSSVWHYYDSTTAHTPV